LKRAQKQPNSNLSLVVGLLRRISKALLAPGHLLLLPAQVLDVLLGGLLVAALLLHLSHVEGLVVQK
jgi:hypothetical protein